jgi:dihydrofolate reductase
MKNTSQLTLSAIVAMAKNRVIGRQNLLPWRLPADLKRFKALTTGHPVIMGRRTYESIGKPLPNRVNIILTHDVLYHAPGCLVAKTVEEAMQYAASHGGEAFVIGGANIYQQFLPQVSRIYLTVIDDEVEGDTYFPLLDEKEWKEVQCEPHDADHAHAYPYRFVVLERLYDNFKID